MSPPSGAGESASSPLAIFVTGLSCTGKTTLAHALSERFGLPVFHKDAFKEKLFDTLYPDGVFDRLTREESRLLGRYSLGCLEVALEQCVRNDVCAIFEANFDSGLFSPRIAVLRAKYPFRATQVHLRCRGDVLFARFVEREQTTRHPGHGGMRYLDDVRAALLKDGDEPLALESGDDLVTVDTTDPAPADYDPLFDLLAKRLSVSPVTA